MKKVAILMGSDSDLPIVQKAIDTLESFNIEYEVHIYSAHRTPFEVKEFVENAYHNNFGVIICAAGMSAHLAGVVASYTVLPIIGIPIKSNCFDGMDALLSTVQMPSGVPVATVAVNGSTNAALLAIQMLAINDENLKNKLIDKRNMAKQTVLDKDKALNLK